MKQVIFYCGKFVNLFQRRINKLTKLGSSAGRGTRCAGWLQDYIDDIAKIGRKTDLKVLVLEGGIKKWVKDFEGSMVEGFEEGYWEQFK
jgi:arsenical-resistance protein 2